MIDKYYLYFTIYDVILKIWLWHYLRSFGYTFAFKNSACVTLHVWCWWGPIVEVLGAICMQNSTEAYRDGRCGFGRKL